LSREDGSGDEFVSIVLGHVVEVELFEVGLADEIEQQLGVKDDAAAKSERLQILGLDDELDETGLWETSHVGDLDVVQEAATECGEHEVIWRTLIVPAVPPDLVCPNSQTLERWLETGRQIGEAAEADLAGMDGETSEKGEDSVRTNPCFPDEIVIWTDIDLAVVVDVMGDSAGVCETRCQLDQRSVAPKDGCGTLEPEVASSHGSSQSIFVGLLEDHGEVVFVSQNLQFGGAQGAERLQIVVKIIAISLQYATRCAPVFPTIDLKEMAEGLQGVVICLDVVVRWLRGVVSVGVIDDLCSLAGDENLGDDGGRALALEG